MYEACEPGPPAALDQWVCAGVLSEAGVAAVDCLPPGPVLAGLLAQVDVSTVSPLESDAVLRAWTRMQSWVAAGRAAAIVKVTEDFRGSRKYVSDDDPGAGKEQVATCLRISPRAAGRHVHLARCLLSTHHRTWQRLATGTISERAAEVVITETDHLRQDQVHLVEQASLDYASTHTPAEISRHITRVIAAHLPDEHTEACQTAAGQRYMRLTPLPNAMGLIQAYLPISEATTIMRTLDTRATQIKDRDVTDAPAGGIDPRDLPGIDLYRADVLTEISTHLIHAITTRTPGDTDAPGGTDAPDGTIAPDSTIEQTNTKPPVEPVAPAQWQAHLHVDLPTALGMVDNPGHIDGYGPIPATLARNLATNANWDIWITTNTNDLHHAPELLRMRSAKYRPPQPLIDLIHARDQRCRFPGCETRATITDIDHAHPWHNGEPTTITNLGALCRRHHRLKTHSNRNITISLPDGTCTWTDPTGTHHTTTPETRLPRTSDKPEPQPVTTSTNTNRDDPPPF